MLLIPNREMKLLQLKKKKKKNYIVIASTGVNKTQSLYIFLIQDQ